MDVLPAGAASAAAIEALLRSEGCRRVINVVHRCGSECRYFRHGSVAVCKSSLHTHRCGRFCVDGSLHASTPEGTTCRLTGLVVRGPEEVLSPKLCGDGTFSRHWEIEGPNPIRSRRRRAVSVATGHTKLRRTVRSTCLMVFLSDARCAAAGRAASKASDRCGRMTTCLHELMGRVAAELQSAGRAVLVPSDRASVEALGRRVSGMVLFAVNAGFRSKNPAVTAAAVLTLMQDGFEVGGCTMVAVDDVCAHYLPTQTQLGAMPGLQCRAITLAIRLLKRFMVTSSGVPRPERALVRENYGPFL